MAKLHFRERRMLLYIGMPAHAVATVERMTVGEVQEIRSRLKARGVLPATPGTEAEAQQRLDVGDVDSLMRTNQPPAGL
jgi:hypothetical protein